MNNVVVEYMEGIEVVKAFNQSTSSYEKYRKAVENFKQTTLNWYKSTWKFTTLGASILPTTLLGVLPIGTLLYLYGSTTLPKITMAMLLSMGMVSSLGRMILFFNQLKSIQYSVNIVNKTFDTTILRRHSLVMSYFPLVCSVILSISGHSPNTRLHAPQRKCRPNMRQSCRMLRRYGCCRL